EEYYDGEGSPEQKVNKNRIGEAWKQGMNAAEQSLPLFKNLLVNLKDGLVMTGAILPSILSVGLLGLVLATFTPVFDIFGYIFLPFTWLVQLPEPLLAAKASSV